MLVLSIVSTVLLSIVGLLALIITPQVETRGQMRMAFGLLLIEVFAIITVWVLYGQI